MKVPKKAKKEKKEEIKAVKNGTLSASASLVKRAWITEKAGDLSGIRKYVFVIDRDVNKSEAKKAIEAIYGTKVESVNVINMKGKTKRLGRSSGKTSAFKKAIVTLKQGEKIDVMPA